MLQNHVSNSNPIPQLHKHNKGSKTIRAIKRNGFETIQMAKSENSHVYKQYTRLTDLAICNQTKNFTMVETDAAIHRFNVRNTRLSIKASN